MIKEPKEDRIPKLRGGVIIRQEDFGLLIFDPKTDTIFETNHIGAEMLQNCDGKRGLSELSKLIADMFETELQVVSSDVKSFLTELVNIGLIEYV